MLLAAGLLLGCTACASQNPPGVAPAADPAPKLTLEGANNGNHCTLSFKTGTYSFKDDDYCENDEAIGIELEHAPSASNIQLFESYQCDRHYDGNDFWMYLRTVKEDVTTQGPIKLEEIIATPPGQVIRPGVRVMDHYYDPNGGINRRVSCVRIDVDAEPIK